MQSAPPQQSAPQAQPLSSLAEQSSQPKRVKLHSPILGGADASEEEGYSKPQLSRLRGTAPGTGGGRPAPPPASPEGRSTGGRKQLRSPLLGGSDEDFDDEEEEPVSRSKPAPRKTGGGGLRSPLLGEGGGDFDDDEPAPRSQGAGKKKLRSPLLGEDDDDEDDYTPTQRGRKSRPTGGAEPPRSSSPSGGLRSPLLGGGDDEPPSSMAPKSRASGGLRSPLLKGGDDYDDEDEQPSRPTASRAPKPGGRPKLHSPMLGESDSYYDDDDDDDEDDDGNPDVLRSPLLAAKKKRPAHPPQGQPTPGQMPGAQAVPHNNMPNPAAYNPAQPQGQPGWGAPPAVPPGQPPADMLVANQPPMPGQMPPNYSQQNMPGMPPQPGMPQQGAQPQGIQPGVPPQFGMPPGMPPQPGMQPGQAPNRDFGAPSAISQSGVQRYQNLGAPPPAEPRDPMKLVSHTSSRSDVSALPSGADEKYAGLSELNKQLDKKEEPIGPSDRRGTDRRKGGRDRRLTSPLVDGGRRYDDSDSDSMPAQKSGGLPAIVPIVIIAGLLCKGLFFQQVLPTNTLSALPWYFWVDQAGTGLALVFCLIIVFMSGGKK